MTQISDGIGVISSQQLAQVLKLKLPSVLIIDSRSFLEYNDGHIVGSVNVNCSKIVKRRLQQEKVSMRDFLQHQCYLEIEAGTDAIVYDQSTVCPEQVAPDSFLDILLEKLQPLFKRVALLEGGFLEFQSRYRDLCEDKAKKCPTLTSVSQPCLPVGNIGLTRILPFLYLGSQQDAHDKHLCQDHSITYHMNVSTNCPKPDFISDGHFLRLSVQDSYGEKLLPHFKKAIQFIDKSREANGCVLVHCLAGISRSPTVAVAFVMKHLRLPFEEAFRYVKSKRPTISPNFNFLGQLLEWERQLELERSIEYPIKVASAPILPKRPTTLRGLPHTLSLSVGIKTPLETVYGSSESSPSGESPAAKTPQEIHQLEFPRPALSDLSPTTQLSNLTFENFGERVFSKSATSSNLSCEKPSFLFKSPMTPSIYFGTTKEEEKSNVFLSHRRSSETCTRSFSIKFSDGNQKSFESKSSHTEISISRRRFDDNELKRTSPPTVSIHTKRQAMSSDRYARSDSATTSGIGSEVSDDVSMETSSVCGSVMSNEESDDGVFLEMVTRRRPRPCSLLGLTPTREVQQIGSDLGSPASSSRESPFTPNIGRKRTEIVFDFEKPSTSQVTVLETMPERPEETVVAPPRRRRSGRGRHRVENPTLGTCSKDLSNSETGGQNTGDHRKHGTGMLTKHYQVYLVLSVTLSHPLTSSPNNKYMTVYNEYLKLSEDFSLCSESVPFVKLVLNLICSFCWV
ncbi:hypothetical protein QYM36_010173 [Artemia franciscana]|uniref:protein-tyrosine-phosphatase n=1 Tax=Artemia franciscana TaxID=6661 RepID=A0AA88HQW1_ARTSF|nr:hypothetical protein QYM36_010173 [Artemia franciscana]